MPLTLEQAAAAGALAVAIRSREEKLTMIQTAIDGGWMVSKFAAVGPDENEVSLIIDRLSAEISGQALAFAKSIYEGQLEALNAQLASIVS